MQDRLFDRGAQSRRSFLKFGAAALAGAALLRTSFTGAPAWAADADAAKSTDPAAKPTDSAAKPNGAEVYGGLIMGIQSYTLRDRSFEKMLDAMQNDLKLHAVELFPNHLAGKSPEQIKKLLADHDVKALSYGVIGFKNGDDEANRKLFELAKMYGMKNLSCDPDPEALESVDKLCKEYGITAAIHPHGPGHRWGTVEQLKKAFDGRSNMIGLCADTGHLIRAGEDPLKVCEMFKERLHCLHLKDFKKKPNGKDWEDVPAGTANLDVDGVVAFLIKNRPAAPVFIEYEGGDPVVSAQQSLERVKQAVAKCNEKK